MSNDTATEFIAHVWSKAHGKVTNRKSYRTEAGALKFAEDRAAADTTREVTICEVGSTRRLVVKRGRGGKITTTEERSSRKFQKAEPRVTTRTPKEPTGPALLRGEPGKVTTWKKALTYTDGALAAGYDARVQVLSEPKGLDLGSTEATAKFDASYLRFLRGDQKWIPTSAGQFGLDADARRERRAAVRRAVAAAAGVEVVEAPGGPVPA